MTAKMQLQSLRNAAKSIMVAILGNMYSDIITV